MNYVAFQVSSLLSQGVVLFQGISNFQLELLDAGVSGFSNILDSLVFSLEFLVFNVAFSNVGLQGVNISLQVGNGLEVKIVSGLEIDFSSQLQQKINKTQ